MSSEKDTVLSILNLLGDVSAADGEIISAINALRRRVKGDNSFVNNLLSVLEIKNRPTEFKSVDRWQSQIDILAKQLSVSEEQCGKLEKTSEENKDHIAKLEANVAFLEKALAEARGTETSVYTLKDLREAVFQKAKIDYGWQVALQAASINSSYGPITTLDIMKWKKVDRVPETVIKAVIQMNFQPRRGKKNIHWTLQDRKYFETLKFVDDNGNKIPYRQIAHICSEKFGRIITEDAIKGVVDRARKRKRKVVPFQNAA